jgi:hypothetical protein
MSIAFDDPHSGPLLRSGASCSRSSLPPVVRLAIFFGVLFTLKAALLYTTLPSTLQLLALAGAATVMVHRFWWACGESRRGAMIIIGAFWLATLAKIIVQQ